MFYGIIFGALAIWSAFVSYETYQWTNNRNELALLKGKITAQRRLAAKAVTALNEAQKQESIDKTAENRNDDLIVELQSKIGGITDNPQCASTDFMRSLGNLR